jgi:hypothetical protein
LSNSASKKRDTLGLYGAIFDHSFCATSVREQAANHTVSQRFDFLLASFAQIEKSMKTASMPDGPGDCIYQFTEDSTRGETTHLAGEKHRSLPFQDSKGEKHRSLPASQLAPGYAVCLVQLAR